MTIRSTLAAVIVTYNRLDKLKLVVEALKKQSVLPERIFVIDNASTDETGDFLADLQTQDPRFQHVRLPENVGGAGGFHEGARIAYEDGFDYIWFSDDDAYPEPQAIELLLTGIIDFEDKFTWRPSFACSSVKWTNSDLCEMNIPNTVWDWPRFYSPDTPYFLVGSCSFVSVLVPRWAFAEHGFPIKDYFIWYDDAEFTQRIAKSYPGIYCPNSIVFHDVPENKGVNFSLVSQKNIWKFRYGARNETSFWRRERGWMGVFSYARRVWGQMRQGKVEARLRREVLLAIWKGCFFTPEIVRPAPETEI